MASFLSALLAGIRIDSAVNNTGLVGLNHVSMHVLIQGPVPSSGSAGFYLTWTKTSSKSGMETKMIACRDVAHKVTMGSEVVLCSASFHMSSELTFHIHCLFDIQLASRPR